MRTHLGCFLDKASEIMMIISMLTLIAMAMLMNVEIVKRTFFHSSTMIADEYSGYFFAWVVLCALTYTQRKNGLLKVNLILDILPHRIVHLLNSLAALLGGIVTGILTWSTFELVLNSFAFGTFSLSTAQTPLYIPQLIMPIGLGLATLSFLESAVNYFIDFKEGKAL